MTIFLAKPNTTEAHVLSKGGLTQTAVRLNDTVSGTLHTRPSGLATPSWVSFFGGTIDANALRLRTASASAVLTVNIGARLFVLTFGYGRSFIDRGQMEDSFGLKVTLNSVQEGSIRSIDRKTFEGITTHVREQASKEGAFSDFGLDVERDLLRAVVGTPADQKDGKRLAGMDALSVAARVDLASLPDLLERYRRRAADDSYRKRHPWIDNISEVRDHAMIEQLNARLVEDLRRKNLERKWLAVPDLMTWSDVGGFRYGASKREELHEDIHLSDYLRQVRDLDKLTIDTLKRHRVRAFSATNEEEFDHWVTFNCLYAELDVDQDTFLLNNGQWYRLDKGFVAEVEGAVQRVPEGAALPTYGTKESETAYNRRLAKQQPGSCLMDRKNISYGGGKSKVEFCDVLTTRRQMIHVKRYRGSAVLSHLFAQGVVSATAFVGDAEFRKRLNKKLCNAHRLVDPLERPRAHQWEVAYAIASKSSTPLRLPFFSRVTLRNATRQLESLGFKVSMTKVQIQ